MATVQFSTRYMKTYEVSYSGNSSRFDGFTSMVNAESKREAVEAVYQSVLDENYFPQEDGTIQDCTGYEIADATDTYIEYDGGYFSAELVLEKVQISHDVDGYPNATISENYESWFVDLGLGLGEAEYYKTDWTLEAAIEDQINIGIE